MKIKIIGFLGIVLLLLPIRVFGDLSPYLTRAVDYCFKISNTEDYPEYVFLQYSKKSIQWCQQCYWNGGHIVINTDDCITSVGKEDSSTVYAIKKEYYNESDISSDIEKKKKYFETNDKLIPSNIIIKPVYFVDTLIGDSKKSDTKKIVDVLRIANLNDNNFELKKEKRIYIQSNGREKWFDDFIHNEDESISYENKSLSIDKKSEKDLVSSQALLNFWYIIPLLAVMLMITIFLLRKFKK